MSLFKMKRGQESKVSSLTKEDGSLIFSLNGANDSTVRLDQTVNGTVQRLGIAVDKAKSADSASSASSATNASTANYAKSAGNADTIDGFHYNEAPYKYSKAFNQPTANTVWYLKVKTPDWNNSSETIKVRAVGNNRNGSIILKVGSRQANWWGYATQYNGTCLTGVRVVISNSNDTYLRFDEGTTSATIYTTFSATIETSTVTDGYTSVPGEGGIFGNIITGTFKGTADNSNALGGSSLSQVLNAAGGGNAFTGLDTTTNNVIKLTRANGGTVQKTINNVSNASSASYSSNSASLGGSPASSYLLRSGGTITGSITLPNSTHDNLVYAGVLEGVGSYTPAQVSTAYKSFIGSAILKDLSWQNLIISRHRNNSGDGTGYGMYLRAPLTAKGSLIWDQQTGNNWQGERTILDSANYTTYAADRTAFSGVSISGRNITFTRANGTTVGITTQDNNSTYPVYGKVLSSTFANGFRSETYGSTNDGWYISAVRNNTASVANAPQYGSGVAWGHSDTHGYLYVSYSSAAAYIGGGNANKLNWQKQLAFLDSTVANATSAENSVRLGGKVASDYALKTDLSGTINAASAKRLESYQSQSIANSFFFRYGAPGMTADGNWTGFPSSILGTSQASTANGFGSLLYQKKAGVVHLAAGSSAHDLVFQAGGTNGGIAYVATGRNPAYILDTLNYKDRAYTFNKLTASSTFTATSGVVIDGGSY